MAYLMIWKERNKFTVAGNHECDETDSVVSEVSSFVDNPVLYLLYIFLKLNQLISQFLVMKLLCLEPDIVVIHG